MSKTYTHKDLSKALKVSETTIKSYRRKFPGCIPIASRGRPIQFELASLDVARRIRDCFSEGMNVKEVRLRLAKEFSWIQPELEKEQKGSKEKITPTPEISQGVSDMAKSMVTMSTHQKGIMKRMQIIESQLENLGLEGHDFNELKEAKVKKDKAQEESLNERINRLDSITGTLADTLSVLVTKMDDLIKRQARQEKDLDDDLSEFQGEDRKPKTNVIAFHKKDFDISEETRAFLEENTKEEKEPGREYLSLPMVVRMADGKYISAGSRGRGRFSLNDLKAILVHGFNPPEHYLMVWEKAENDWWLVLTQPELKDGKTISMQFKEIPTKQGNSVLEITQLRKGIQALHPAEICSIIESLSSTE